jgi:hypothetical protein
MGGRIGAAKINAEQTPVELIEVGTELSEPAIRREPS